MLMVMSQQTAGSLKRASIVFMLTSGLVSAIHATAFADTLESQIKLITDTADKICNVVSTTGNSQNEQVKGEVKAQLNGLASKLADVGVSGTGGLNNEHYQNVLQQDLAAALKNNADCKLQVFQALQQKLLITSSETSSASSSKAPDSHTRSVPYTDQFVGSWKNENPQTNGVTRIEINNRLGDLSMHVWGRCTPTECDNGNHPLTAESNQPDVVSFDYVIHTISEKGTLAMQGEGKLQMELFTHFNDTSNRPDLKSVYRFIRS